MKDIELVKEDEITTTDQDKDCSNKGEVEINLQGLRTKYKVIEDFAVLLKIVKV